MTLKFACPHCGKTLSAREEFAGRNAKCSGCGEMVVVPAADVRDAESFETAPPNDEAPPASHNDTKLCPVCGEVIKAVALKCRFCGEDLGIGKLQRAGGVWRDGKLLVMSKTAELPPRCVKTNQPTDRWLKRSLSWHNQLLYLLILFPGLLVYVIVALIVRKSAAVRVGLSPQGFSRRRWGIAAGWLSFLIGFGLVIVGLSYSTPNNAMWILAVVGLVGGLIGILVGVAISAVVSAAKITDEHVWLKGVHPDYLAMLPAWSE